MTNVVSVSIPAEVIDKAKKLNINVSKTAREAVISEVERREKEGVVK